MADQIDPSQIDNLTTAINNLTEILGGKTTTVQKEDIKNFDDLGKVLKGSLKDFNNLKKGVTAASQALGTMADGVDGVSRFSDSIESAADTVATLGAVIGTIVGGPLGLLVAGLGAGVLAVAKYNKAVAKQADDLYKSYQDISRAGVVGAQGVDDIFKNMQKLGYGVEELGKMGALLKENSEILSQFGGTAIQGTKTLADMSKGINDAGLSEKFLNMGISIDQQNKGMAGYLKLQAATGLAGKQTQEELTKSAAAYIEKQDLLTKITGQTAEKQQEQFERAASEERLGAKIRELERTGQKEQAQALREGYAQLARFPKLQKGFADISTGFIGSSKEAAQYMRTAPRSAAELMKNNANVSKALDSLGTEAEQNTKQMDKLRMARGDVDAFASGAELAGVTSQFKKSQEERMALAKREQDLAAKGVNQTTKNLVQNEVNQRKSRDDLQKARQAGAGVVTGIGAGISGAGAGITGVPGKVAPGLAPERLPPGTTPGGSFDAVKKGITEGVKEGVKQAPPVKTAPTPGAPGPGDVKSNLELMKGALMKQGITDPNMIKATLANVMKETGGKNVTENLAGYKNTSNERIRKIFGSRAAGKTDEELNAIKADEQKMGEMVYGGGSKIGQSMGNTEPGDGWKFRGRGFIQLTGKNNYSAASKAIFGDDRLVKNPDLVNDPAVAAEVSAWFMKKNTGGMAKALGMDTANMSQEQANVLATSVIAGGDIRKKGAIGEELLGKVNTYAGQMGNIAGPTSGYQPTAMAGVNPAATLPTTPQTAANQPAPGSAADAQTTMLAQMLDKLDLIARSSQQQVATTKKMAAQQA